MSEAHQSPAEGEEDEESHFSVGQLDPAGSQSRSDDSEISENSENVDGTETPIDIDRLILIY